MFSVPFAGMTRRLASCFIVCIALATCEPSTRWNQRYPDLDDIASTGVHSSADNQDRLAPTRGRRDVTNEAAYWKRSDDSNFWKEKRGQDAENQNFWKRFTESSGLEGDWKNTDEADAFWKRDSEFWKRPDESASFWKRGPNQDSFWKQASDGQSSSWKKNADEFLKRSISRDLVRFLHRSTKDKIAKGFSGRSRSADMNGKRTAEMERQAGFAKTLGVFPNEQRRRQDGLMRPEFNPTGW